jgi:hypothetical protein
VIVRVNPLRRDDLPRTAREILNRVNEISFNSSLLRELRAIGFISRLIDQGLIKEGALKRVLVHGIDAEDYMAGLGYSSKLNPAWDFLAHLHDVGRESAGRWLELNFDQLGVPSTLDIDGEFLEGVLPASCPARPDRARRPAPSPARDVGGMTPAAGARRRWRRPSIELSLEEVMADATVHLVMRRDWLAPDDIWAVIDQVRHRHRRRTEQKSSNTTPSADHEVLDVSQSAL